MERSSSQRGIGSNKQTLRACIALCALSIAVGCGDDDDGSFVDAGKEHDSGLAADGGMDGSSEFPADAGPPPPSCDYDPAENMGNVISTETPSPLPEISGLGASRVNRGILWVVNDKHNTIAVNAITTTGIHVATYILSGVDDTHDNEDLAVGPGPEAGESYIYIGGIGDNSGTQADLRVYRVIEPVIPGFGDVDGGVADGGVADGGIGETVINDTLDVRDHLVMQYPGGVRRNAEALMVDPVTKDVFVVSKDAANGFNRVFRNPFPQAVNNAESPTQLEQVGVVRMGSGLDIGVTGADIAGDGSMIIVRTLRTARIWERSEGQRIMDALATTVPCDYALAREPKGEAICFNAEGTGFYATSEGENQPLFFTSLE